jgi:hypothetical protein
MGLQLCLVFQPFVELAVTYPPPCLGEKSVDTVVTGGEHAAIGGQNVGLDRAASS